MKNPISTTRKYFDYLVSQYGYRIAKEEFSPEAMGNAYVTYISDLTGIQISIDRSQVLINIGSITDNVREWFDFSDVIKYFNPSVEEPYVFIKKTDNIDTDDIVESQIKRLSSLLRIDCEPIIKGELWMKEEIKALEQKRVTEQIEKLNKLYLNPKTGM